MKMLSIKRVAIALLLLTSVACQRTFTATPTLQTTDVPVAKFIPEDPELESQIEPYRKQVTQKMTEIIGNAPVALGTANYQSPLGNFIVDLLLSEARERYDGQLDIATTTNGGLRVPIPMGVVKVGDIFELMPFENELVVLTLKGSDMKALFDLAAAYKYAPIANATYSVKDGKATAVKIGGQPLDENKNYKVVTSDYLAGGGDNMVVFKNAIKTEKVGIMMRDAIIEHIQELTAKGLPIVGDTANRVTILP